MNTGGQASEKTLRDEFAGQALTGLCSSWYDRHKDDPLTQRGHGPTLISQSAYTHAEAMLAEKARREATGKRDLQVEAVVKESSTTDHSEDSLGKVAELEAANRELVEALDSLEVWGDELGANVNPPSRNCSCHINPPCNDCVDFTGQREAKQGWEDAKNKARAILVKHKGAA